MTPAESVPCPTIFFDESNLPKKNVGDAPGYMKFQKIREKLGILKKSYEISVKNHIYIIAYLLTSTYYLLEVSK